MIKTHYVLKYDNGNFVALDRDSGGYPYQTSNPNMIKFWETSEEAKSYQKMFPYLKLVSIKFNEISYS